MNLRLLFLIGMSLGCATNNNALSQPTSSFTEDDVLRVIDTTCGDSWCESDYNYKFLSVQFNISRNTTTLFFQRIKDEKEILDRKCEIEGYSSPDEIITHHDLEPEFYDKLNSCISGSVR
jgi:hypothetical protein